MITPLVTIDELDVFSNDEVGDGELDLIEEKLDSEFIIKIKAVIVIKRLDEKY